MTTMLETVVPKSDQLNADDLMGGQTKTIKITNVSIAMGEQPVSIHYEGDNGKPYKPGKSMRRVLIHCWGADANKYVGRSLTLYRDDKVKFGGADVGGIRISHMSDIPDQVTIALTATRAQRKPFTVKPLIAGSSKGRTSDFDSGNAGSSPAPATSPTADEYIADFAKASMEELKFKWKANATVLGRKRL